MYMYAQDYAYKFKQLLTAELELQLIFCMHILYSTCAAYRSRSTSKFSPIFLHKCKFP